MTRRFLAVVLGLLLGVVLAVAVAPIVGIYGFFGSRSAILFGYASAAVLGAVISPLASGRASLELLLRRSVAGVMLAVLATYVVRSLPSPWVNLVPLDGTSGPASEMPLLTLPALGALLAFAFSAIRAPLADRSHKG